jgi:uncharacterized small protein (DUF1192 family)
MKKPKSIIAEILLLNQMRLSAIKLSNQFPNDNLLKLNIEQIKNRIQLLKHELHRIEKKDS